MSSPCYLRESFQTFTKSAEERGCLGGVCGGYEGWRVPQPMHRPMLLQEG